MALTMPEVLDLVENSDQQTRRREFDHYVCGYAAIACSQSKSPSRFTLKWKLSSWSLGQIASPASDADGPANTLSISRKEKHDVPRQSTFRLRCSHRSRHHPCHGRSGRG